MLLTRRITRFYSRLDYLSGIIGTVDATAKRTTQQVFAAERALIQVQIEWEHFVRNLILDSATGQFANASGPVISELFTDLRSREAAAHRLIGTYRNRQHEPDWYLPAQAIDASMRLGVSNRSQIAAELGLAPWPIDELRHVRNFIAHRSKRSALNVRGSGIVAASANIDVLEVALGYGPNGAQRYIEWIDFSKGAAKRLVA